MTIKRIKRMTPGLRKLVLVTHVTTSVSSIGAVCGFLALAVIGLTTANEFAARSAYMSMEVIAWAAILPLLLASLVTGLIQGLSSEWGIFRHYWVAGALSGPHRVKPSSPFACWLLSRYTLRAAALGSTDGY